jgi:hypothetical protein
MVGRMAKFKSRAHFDRPTEGTASTSLEQRQKGIAITLELG